MLEFAAAILRYEEAGHERYCATNRNKVAMLLYKLGRYGETHEQLDRAAATLSGLGDEGLMAQVYGTRARVLIAEQKCEESIDILRRAVAVAEESGALTDAGLAALTLIEEQGAGRLLSAKELYSPYDRADEFLKHTRDAEDVARLRACAEVVMRRLAEVRPHDKDFSFYGAVQGLEAKLIGEALEESGGSVSRAARLLGLKHQTLISIVKTRHKLLQLKRTPPGRRPRGAVRKGC